MASNLIILSVIKNTYRPIGSMYLYVKSLQIANTFGTQRVPMAKL